MRICGRHGIGKPQQSVCSILRNMRHRKIVEEEDNFVGWDGFSKDATMIGQEHKLATQLRGHDYFRRCNSGAHRL